MLGASRMPASMLAGPEAAMSALATAEARIAEARIIEGGKAVRLTWGDGGAARFHAIWLRDNALDPETRASGNGQRLIAIADVPDDITIAAARLTEAGGLALRLMPEGKEIVFAADWLGAPALDQPAPYPAGGTSNTLLRSDCR